MLFLKTMILGLVAFLANQATTQPIELGSNAKPASANLTCTYSYNAIYDWYIVKGEGWLFRNKAITAKVKKCAEDAGSPTGWVNRNTDDINGNINVQFRLELGLPRPKLQRCLEKIQDNGKKVKCKRVFDACG